MTDLRQRLHELDQLEAPDMRAAIDRRAQQLRAASTGARHRDVVVVAIGALETDRSERRWLPYVVLAAAAVIVAVVSIALFGRTEQSSPIDVIDGPADVDQPEPTVSLADATLTGIRGIRSAADSVWAWDESQIWRYRDDTWAPYSPTPAPPVSAWQDPEYDGDTLGDLAHDGDTLWALTESGVLHLEGDDWVELTEAPSDAWSLDADPRTGIMWVSTGDELYRWNGEEMTNVGHPPNRPETGDGDGWVGDILVAEDGGVWATGLLVWVPHFGGLARYDDTMSSWEVVRPGRDDLKVPALAMATTPDGGLWVMLADWFEDWEQREATGEPTVVATLAHHDGAIAEWSVHDEGLPEVFPLAMTADTEAVWLVQERPSMGDDDDLFEISRFDGQTWTHYLAATSVADMAAAPDGTIWLATGAGDLRRVVP